MALRGRLSVVGEGELLGRPLEHPARSCVQNRLVLGERLVRRAMLGRHERFGDMETVEFGRSVLDGHDETEMIPVIVALAEGLHDDGGHFNAEALNLFKPGPTDG